MVGSVGIEPTEPLQRQIYSLDRLLNGITTQKLEVPSLTPPCLLPRMVDVKSSSLSQCHTT